MYDDLGSIPITKKKKKKRLHLGKALGTMAGI
jgi:hypothetical protein